MSVVILGMEISKNCHVCGLCFGGLCYAMPPEVDEMCPDEDRPGWCPLRPLPDAHGDLIDRDAARGSIKPWSPEDERNACTFATVKKLLNTMLDHAPTVVEAEGE